jgi:AcrR family transcriptional regulator
MIAEMRADWSVRFVLEKKVSRPGGLLPRISMTLTHDRNDTYDDLKVDVALARRSDEILAAAVDLFASHGFAATDVQQIADKAGVGKGTVYRHFTNKDKLFLAAADLGLRQLKDAVNQSADGQGNALERLRGGVMAFLRFFREHPEFVDLMIQERAHFRDRESPTFFGRKDDEMTCQWRDEFKGLIEQGILRPLPVEHLMDFIEQSLFGAVLVHFLGKRDPLTAASGERTADMILNGIAMPGAYPTK